jgi:hypothetical protein
MPSFRIGNRVIIGERETWVLLLRLVFDKKKGERKNAVYKIKTSLDLGQFCKSFYI